MATKQTAVPARKSKTFGVGGELSVFLKVKPGHAEAMRDAIAKWDQNLSRGEGLMKTTLTDTRFVLFDNDTRCLFATNFDGPWDPYIEDIIRAVPAAFYDEVFGNFEGYPEGGLKTLGMDGVKQFVNDNQIGASGYWRRWAQNWAQCFSRLCARAVFNIPFA